MVDKTFHDKTQQILDQVSNRDPESQHMMFVLKKPSLNLKNASLNLKNASLN